MKRLLLLTICLYLINGFTYAESYQLSSPNQGLIIEIHTDSILRFEVFHLNERLLPSTTVAMELKMGLVLGKEGEVKNVATESMNTTIRPVVPVKNSMIVNRYNELAIDFRGHYRVVFRAYDDAVAYRFETNFEDSIIVQKEQVDLLLDQNTKGWFALSKSWRNDYQNLHEYHEISELSDAGKIQLPILLDLKQQGKVLITESDLMDYPGLSFKKAAVSSGLESIFPSKAKTTERVKRKIFPKTTYDYIAHTIGTRSFPWRIFAFADSDEQLLNNEIVYKLASPSQIKETNWITPGQVTWDWWNHLNITGVDFEAGINTATYQYYIDFASRNHIPYLMVDDGWDKDGDILQFSDDVDLPTLVAYGREKGVDLLLWCMWHKLDDKMETAMQQFEDWGIKGIKVDFMDRDDQDMINFYWRCAEKAADHHLLVNFHGSHKPTGIYRTYPNVLNFEGVVGLEAAKGSNRASPEGAVKIPYIRMFAGPLDYTPGAMRNAQKNGFEAIRNNPMSLGTRAQQLAMYVLYDAPLQMLADNPTAYEDNKESLDFITSVPTAWDETIPLSGKVGEYVLMARRKGNSYYVGAMTNWNSRELMIDFSFLPAGTWNMELHRDGVNADRNGIDYKRIVKKVNNQEQLKIAMAPGGGWVARIYK